MKHTITLISCMLLMQFCLIAQVFNDSPVLKQYDKESIFLQGNRSYIKNGERHRVGMFFKKLEKEMEISPVGILEYKKAKRNRGFALAANIGLGISYAYLVSNDKIYSSPRNALLWSSSVLALSVVSIKFNMKAYNDTQRALWYRNRDVLLLVD